MFNCRFGFGRAGCALLDEAVLSVAGDGGLLIDSVIA
jgi:hypothetical protein